ncbi:MAG TPA: hypothetical protein VL857_12045 [Candidatus Eisenbacteria bacterium]|nr:hypothetical protein [Candidatus Eisenbacteria bacterium]
MARPPIVRRGAFVLLVGIGLALAAEATATPQRGTGAPIDSSVCIDGDTRPIPMPKVRDPNLAENLYREGLMDQLSTALDIPDRILWALQPFGVTENQRAANINKYDEVPASSWFTPRNHVHALRPDQIRNGPDGPIHPQPPYTITSTKKGGVTVGWQMKDAADHRWIVKLDPKGHPQLGSGAAVVSGRLIWAAGYNFSQDEAFSFTRDELKIDDELRKGKDGDKPFTEELLDALLREGATANGRYYAAASLYLKGKPAGPLSFASRRDDDPNDWYHHKNRRELRGLYVVYSWVNNWDVKDQQSLDMFHEDEGSKEGHLVHNLLDASGSLGAAGQGPKQLPTGYEERIDFGWTMKRILTLGFVVEPWRKVKQESGIPSVGNFEAEGFKPKGWKAYQTIPPWREMTRADAYWGAKLVASFSDAQIMAAIDAAGYEDPAARDYLFRVLVERRNRIARTWFKEVTPLDFFIVQGNALRFRDLAVDVGAAKPREYEVVTGKDKDGIAHTVHLTTPELPLDEGPLARVHNPLTLEIRAQGLDAKPVRVTLAHRGPDWAVMEVRHE